MTNKPIREINMGFEDNLETSESQEFMERLQYYFLIDLESGLVGKINDEATLRETEQKIIEILDRVEKETGFEITLDGYKED